MLDIRDLRSRRVARGPRLACGGALRGLALALTELEDSYISLWGTLSRVERAAVVAVADGLSPTSRRVAADHGTARSSMQRAVERLEGGSQLLTRRDQQLLLLDPLLAEWIRRR